MSLAKTDQKRLEALYEQINIKKPNYYGRAGNKDYWFAWLNKLDYQVNKDLTIDVNESVILDTMLDDNHKYIFDPVQRIPFDFKNVKGNFFIDPSFRLIRLKGCPKFVKGNFICDDNSLISLEGGPEEVGGHYSCSSNQLETLEGSPKIVKGNFNCSNNYILKSLKGSPDYVGKNFYCISNYNIRSLEGFHTNIEGEFKIDDELLYKEYMKFRDLRRKLPEIEGLF